MNLNEIRKLTQKTAIPTILTVEQASSDLVHHCQPACLPMIHYRPLKSSSDELGEAQFFGSTNQQNEKSHATCFFKDSSIFFLSSSTILGWLHSFWCSFCEEDLLSGWYFGFRSNPFRHWEESEQRISGRPSVLPNRRRLWFRNRNRIIIQQKKKLFWQGWLRM